MQTDNQHITELLERCKNKDKNAFLSIYKLYYKAMYNTAYRVLKDDFEAEDIMQESFLTAFTKLNTFKANVTFGAWLKRIVINKSLTQLKKNKTYSTLKLSVVHDKNEAEVLFEKNDKAKMLLQKISSLKENYRVAITLHYIEGYDYEEISDILKISNENVRTTLHRAKQKLKKMIKSEKKLKNEKR